MTRDRSPMNEYFEIHDYLMSAMLTMHGDIIQERHSQYDCV